MTIQPSTGAARANADGGQQAPHPHPVAGVDPAPVLRWIRPPVVKSGRPEPLRWMADDNGEYPPTVARIYDAALGGVHNVIADRELWNDLVCAYPRATAAAHANRAFMLRAVHWLLERGIRQFLDLGCGIPTGPAVHEIVHAVDPDARVAYIDLDPAAYGITRTRIAEGAKTMAIGGDIRHVVDYLYGGMIPHFLDFGQPVAVLAGAVLHYLPSGQPGTLLDSLAFAIFSGSYLVLTHAGPETTDDQQEQLDAAVKLLDRTPTPIVTRTPAQITAMLGDEFELLPPGVTSASQWHPGADEPGECPSSLLAAIARKREPGVRR